jgi:hypothetical protein
VTQFQSPEAWLAARRAREAKVTIVGYLILGLLLSCLYFAFCDFLHERHSKPATVVLIEGKRAMIPLNDRGDNKLWQQWESAANLANQKWSAALGRPPLSFSLIANPDGCGPDAIACAAETTQTVWIAKDGADVDRTTIMMHEIGHLLGVPHIEDDPLMNPAYKGLLDVPSPVAVAVAKSKNLVVSVSR